MPRQTLQEQFEAIRETANPEEGLYAIAQSLRDIGLSQLELYRIFMELYHRHNDDEDSAFFDSVCDVLDCIWGNCHETSALYGQSLTEEMVRIVSVDAKEVGDGHWELLIAHPHLHLRFSIGGPSIVRYLLVFLGHKMSLREAANLRLGVLGDGTVSIIKDEIPYQFSFLVDAADGTLRYTLNVNDLGDYVHALSRVVANLPDAK
jgi:hypothetical protein